MTDTRLLVNGMTVDQLIDFHRSRFGDLRMADDGDGGQQPAPEAPADEANAPKGDEQKPQEQTFTQADVDKIVKERVSRERAKFSDYDDLKAKAGEKQTAEERLAELEQKYAAAEARSLRAEVASEFGISAEDRDLFLTGADADTLTAQAKRLSERTSERKKQGNYVPKIGNTPNPGESDGRETVRDLFGSPN